MTLKFKVGALVAHVRFPNSVGVLLVVDNVGKRGLYKVHWLKADWLNWGPVRGPSRFHYEEYIKPVERQP